MLKFLPHTDTQLASHLADRLASLMLIITETHIFHVSQKSDWCGHKFLELCNLVCFGVSGGFHIGIN